MTWRWGLVVSCSVSAACSCQEESDDAEDTDSDTDGLPIVDSDPLSDLTGRGGSVVLVHAAPDTLDAVDVYRAVAVFPDDDENVLNLAYCLQRGAPCLGAPPAPGETVEGLDVAFMDYEDTYDVGALDVGGTNLTIDPSVRPYTWYSGVPTSWSTTGAVNLDGDYAAYVGTNDFTFVTPIEVTTPDPLARIVAFDSGGLVTFTWTPGQDTLVLEVGSAVTVLDDDGSHDLALDGLGLVGPVDFRQIKLARTRTTDVDAAGNTIHVQTRSEQSYELHSVDASGATEMTVPGLAAETCLGAALLPPIGPGDYWGDLYAAENDIALLDDNPLTLWATDGNEVVTRIDLLTGQTLVVEYLTVNDASVYLLSASCVTEEGYVGSDETFGFVPEIVAYTAVENGPVFLVLDSWLPGGDVYALTIDVK